jgi:hypothetical protein
VTVASSRLVFVFQLRSTFRGGHPELADEPCPALYLETTSAVDGIES